MISPTSAVPSAPPVITDNESVRVLGSVETPQQVIPPGSDGTVVATLEGGAAEVQFGPPVSAVETVSQDVLAIA